ncbi:MAG: hypothetical protein GY861_16590 [bacterium]|nr:hypothetical protein [bacterium]
MTDDALNIVIDKEELFIRNICLGLPWKEAAREAGYSDSMVQSGIYQKKHSVKFLQRIRDYAEVRNIESVPVILNIKEKMLSMAQDNLKSESKEDQDKGFEQGRKIEKMMQSTLVDTGVAKREQEVTHQTINVKNLQQFMVKVSAERQKAIEGEVIE